MKSKRPYTIYVPIKLLDGMTEQEEMDAIEAALIKGSNSVEDDTKLCASWMDNRIRNGMCRHLFIQSKGFADWLVDCSERPSTEHLILMEELVKATTLVYHFPCGIGWHSFSLTLPRSPETERCDQAIVLKVSRNAPKSDGGGFITRFRVDDKDYDLNQISPLSWRAVRLAVSLAMYAVCFPEMVIPGVPNDLAHPSQHKSIVPITFEISAKVCPSGTHDSPCAHYRKGHFRVLRSEKFTHKRFQVVFVHDTFVKGKASTVLAPEEAIA